jgi:predicted nuclease of predicted toxin-antitoxin system
MKFLADAHISRAMVNYLLGLGHDVIHVAVISPRMSDSNILKLAAAEGRVVLTADKDFGELCFLRLIPCIGVILLRLIAPTETARLEIFKLYWPVIEKYVSGHFIVVTDKSVRRSLLPTTEEQ